MVKRKSSKGKKTEKDAPVTAKMEIIEDEQEVIPKKTYNPPRKSSKSVMSGTDEVLIGIDLGSYLTKISASNGIRAKINAIMGWPKDPISRKFIGKDVVFGDEVTKKRLALNIYEPIKELQQDPKDVDGDALVDFFTELVDISGASGKRTTALICIPARTTKDYMNALRDSANEIFDKISFVPGPLAQAVALDQMHGLIVDIGASYLNLGRIYGSVPTNEDYSTIEGGSSNIDSLLMEAIAESYADAQITEEMVRSWKEAKAFIGRPTERIKVEAPINGVPGEIDITESLGGACESIIPSISESIHKLISTFDPEFQPMMRESINITGGGSSIRGLPQALEESLSDMRVKIRVIKDPMYLSADGALRILQEVPELIEEE